MSDQDKKLAAVTQAQALLDEARLWLAQSLIFAEQADSAIANSRICHGHVARLTAEAKELTDANS